MIRQLYLIVYDISDDRRRLKIAKRCEAMADRVQRSVFEGYYSKSELEKLLEAVRQIMVEEEDSLRIYMLCERCRSKVATCGQGDLTPRPGLIIV